jgi:cytochrome c
MAESQHLGIAMRKPSLRLMHCLACMPGLTLSTGLALVFSAFFAAHAQAQNTPVPIKPSAPSAERGLAIYQAKCIACHSADENRVGPAHWGVVGRRAGLAKDYEYSEALTISKLVWNAATLNAWLTDPEKAIPGQRMGYRLSLAQERADVIAYLATLKTTK